ncbi:MAG: leucyl aminopeptidase [Alphaproteobacteria bacterium]
MDIQFVSASQNAHADILFRGFDGNKLSGDEIVKNEKLNVALYKMIEAAEFNGEWGETINYFGNDDFKQITIIGIKKEVVKNKDILRLGGVIAKLARKKKKVMIELSPLEDMINMGQNNLAILAQAIMIGDWRFLKYKSDADQDKSQIEDIMIACQNKAAAEFDFLSLKAAAQGMAASRELVSEPGNILYPQSFTEHAKELESLGCEVEILDVKALSNKGMGAILAVGQGSIRPPYMAIIRWKGAEDKQEAPIAFVGKGVTFDTGGISIKPAAGMEEMIFDMGGAAAAFGAIKSLALRKAKVNVSAILGLAENMPDGNATRPGDIIKTYSGKTVEVINTDAEGRLVLADCLTYAQKDEGAKTVINLATLTGAMMVALGEERAGIFSNDDQLAQNLLNAGDNTNELLWRFPLGEEYDGQIKSKHADIKNMGKGRWGGAIAAAKFLQAFIEDDTKWAHIDMAPTAWINEEKLPICPGATGYGARLLDCFIMQSVENKED